MRRLVLAGLILLLSSSVASANTHRLSFYADRNATSCDLAVNYPGFLEVHVVLEGEGLVVGMGFRAVKPACMRSAVWVADAWDWDGGIVRGGPGNTQHPEGAVVNFVCHALPIYVGRILYMVSEPTDPCCQYAPTPYLDGAPDIIEVDRVGWCDKPYPPFYFETAESRGLVMNANGTCGCNLPLPTQPSTWGSVKALYR